MVDPLSYFSFQPVLHDWCNKSAVCIILGGFLGFFLVLRSMLEVCVREDVLHLDK